MVHHERGGCSEFGAHEERRKSSGAKTAGRGGDEGGGTD